MYLLLVSKIRLYLTNIYILQSAKILYDNISDDERLTTYLTGLPSAFSGMARVVWSTTATPIDKLNDV